MKLTDIEENSLRLIAVLGCNMYRQITVGNVTLPKAVLSKVKIFSVCIFAVSNFCHVFLTSSSKAGGGAVGSMFEFHNCLVY